MSKRNEDCECSTCRARKTACQIAKYTTVIGRPNHNYPCIDNPCQGQRWISHEYNKEYVYDNCAWHLVEDKCCKDKCCKDKCGGGTQIITSSHQKLDLTKDFIEFNREDWKPNAQHKHTCGVYMLELDQCCLPKVGKQITFTNIDKQTNILGATYDRKYGNFWHITLENANDFVTLEWVDKNEIGWTIIAMASGVHVHRLNGRALLAYVLCTIRGFDRNPEAARDFVATVDIDPLSPNYNTIIDISWGSDSGFEGDHGIEYHHGGLIEVGHNLVLVAGSLRWNTSDTPNGGSHVDYHQLLSKRNPVKSTRAVATTVAAAGACAVHTVRQNPFNGSIIASYLGTPGTGDDEGSIVDGPGGFITLKTNFLTPDPIGTGVSNYHTIGADTVAEFGPTQIQGIEDKYNYDFAISHCERKLVCSSWAPPKSFDPSFNPALPYGRSIRVYDMPSPGGPTISGAALKLNKLFYTNPVPEMGGPIDGEGLVPLEVRKLNDPHKEIYFVGITLPGAVDLIYVDEITGEYRKKVAITPQQIANDCATVNLRDGSSIPGGCPIWPSVNNLRVPLVTDITLSNDDTLYVSCWLGGAVLQYDIKDPFNVVFLDGIGNLGGVTSIAPFTNVFNTASRFINGHQFTGGSQMLRVSPDGEMLYLTNSLFSGWDKEFFPNGSGSIETEGCDMIAIKTGVIKGNKTSNCVVDTSFGISSKNLNVIFPDGSHGTIISRLHEIHIEGVPH